MESKQVLIRKSDCGKIVTYIETDTSLAIYHDFVLREKGWAVDKMVKIHNDQVQEAKEKLGSNLEGSESPMEDQQTECASQDCTQE